MTTNEKNPPTSKYTNSLINESSPYLLQHAHNPVDWMPWGEEALNRAKEEDKPLLISIGYSACHWCHVMEHESFEDTAVASIMNKNFICIKVDREERPDIDQVYMDAVQLMTGSGGWPLNCFATPEGKPFYGGTYFPKKNWLDVLEKIKTIYTDEREKVEEYAQKLSNGVQQSELMKGIDSSESEFHISDLSDGLKKWETTFDPTYGGTNQAPKFPLPNNYLFLMHYYFHTKDENIKEHINISLKKMAYGGIYDQIGGGFSRYSTDMQWKVPHFEKMLYDNAQLISLYAQAYRFEKNPLYKEVVEESIRFVEEELTANNGAFYSALDADSEGEEGKYYVWKKEELQTSLSSSEYEIASSHFNINRYGLWEYGNYILIRKKESKELAEEADLSLDQYQNKLKEIKEKLKNKRSKRVKPGLDDKSLTSWNALMISGLVNSYLSFEKKEYLSKAEKNATFILTNQRREDGGLWHNYKSGKSTINGYLEDYCFTIQAFLELYEATLSPKWLAEAKSLTDYAIEHFYDETSGLFFFTSKLDPALFARKKEIIDNVIPASNSSMASVLFKLGKYYPEEDYQPKSKKMLQMVKAQLNRNLSSFSNWGILLLEQANTYYEVAICGENAIEKVLELHQHYIPNQLIMGMESNDPHLSLLEDKWREGETTIYVCENRSCKKPVTKVEDAIQQMITE